MEHGMNINEEFSSTYMTTSNKFLNKANELAKSIRSIVCKSVGTRKCLIRVVDD